MRQHPKRCSRNCGCDTNPGGDCVICGRDAGYRCSDCSRRFCGSHAPRSGGRCDRCATKAPSINRNPERGARRPGLKSFRRGR